MDDRLLRKMCCVVYDSDNPTISGYESYPIKVGNLFACIFSNDEYHVVVFRGTDDIDDWKINFNYDINAVGIHKGFNDAYYNSGLRSELFKRFLNIYDDIYITGHSLGGALATICACDMWWMWNIKGVVTFGSPRVGDSKFVKSYNNDLKDVTKRYVNNNDVVCKIPKGSYRHVAGLRYINRQGRMYNKISFLSLFIDRIIGRLTSSSLLDGIEDHKISNYRC